MLDKSKVRIPERFKDHPIFNTFHCGMNFGFMSKRGYYARKDILEQPAKMAALGTNWATLNANICQKRFYSTKLFLDFEFSSGEIELADMAKALHDNGIRVLLKPCLTMLDSSWMGHVKFPHSAEMQIQGVSHSYWEDWFKSYGDGLKYFGEFAERQGIDAMIIGAELFGTEGQSDSWRQLIRELRDVYSGPMTYEFMPCSAKTYALDWFEDLDFLSYSHYPPAAPCNGTPLKALEAKDFSVEEMLAHLAPVKDAVSEMSRRFWNMPVAFTEIGTRSGHGMCMSPGDYQQETRYDGEEQARYMEACFKCFDALPSWMGLYWWKWDETQKRPHYHADPKGDMGFTIQGKPAEKVWAKWAGKLK